MKDFKDCAKFMGVVNELKFVQRWNGTVSKFFFWQHQESTAAHTNAMSVLAMYLEEFMPDGFNADHAKRLIDMHDMPEAKEGDTTFNRVATGKIDKSAKHAREMSAMLGICGIWKNPKLQEKFMSYYREYDECKTLEARFAKVVDKSEAALYSLNHVPNLGWRYSSFMDGGSIITHLNSACGLVPQLDPFLLFIKTLQREKFRAMGLPWREEYNGPEGWRYRDAVEHTNF